MEKIIYYAQYLKHKFEINEQRHLLPLPIWQHLEIQIPNPSTLDKKLKKHKRASDHIRRIRSNCDSYLDFLNLFKYENVLQTVHASQPNYINEWLPGEMCLPHP